MQQAPMPTQDYQQVSPRPRMPPPGQPTQLQPDPQFGSAVSEWRAGFRSRALISVLVVVIGGLLAIAGASSDNVVLLVFALLASAAALAFAFAQQAVLVMLVVRLLTKKSQKPASVVLLGKDGSKVTLSNTLKGYDSLIDSLVPYLTGRLFGAAQADLGRGVPVAFGTRLVFDPAGDLTYTGLLKKRYVLPYANIAAVNIERAAVLIVQRDTGKTWQSLHVRSVPNIGVLQRLVTR